MPRVTLPLTSNQPDPRVLQTLAVLQRICILAVTLVSGVTLGAWLLPPVGKFLPIGWNQIEANTAFCALLSALSLALSSPRRSPRSVLISRVLALFAFLIAGITAVEYLTHSSALHPGRDSAQAACAFLLLGVLMVFIRVRKSVFSYLIDAVALVLCTYILVFFYGSIFGAMHLFEVSPRSQLSLLTLTFLVLLAFVAFIRRAEYGIFSILIAGGICGNTARFAAPFAIILPFIRSTGRGLHYTEHATALASLIAFCLIFAICRRIDGLEKHIHDLSLRDELTGLYNRRGFFVLADQALGLAQRSGEPFSVLFIDIDNLKEINDAHGHEAGSALLQEMASLLRTTFRETDILGRLGGDEFVVAGRASSSEISRAAQRLEAATMRRDDDRIYPLHFSSGHVTTDNARVQTLEDMLQRADQIMYETKRLKKSLPPTPTSPLNQPGILLGGELPHTLG
jgi:diguanylate cyclase (GGDEF)-like protein